MQNHCPAAKPGLPSCSQRAAWEKATICPCLYPGRSSLVRIMFRILAGLDCSEKYSKAQKCCSQATIALFCCVWSAKTVTDVLPRTNSSSTVRCTCTTMNGQLVQSRRFGLRTKRACFEGLMMEREKIDSLPSDAEMTDLLLIR